MSTSRARARARAKESEREREREREVEHRPSTTPRHCALFWAALVIPDQLVPCCFSSASVPRLQLLRGRPLFLCPCGFQVRAWRVVLDAGFLRVCPIQPYFLPSICLATTTNCTARFYFFVCLYVSFCDSCLSVAARHLEHLLVGLVVKASASGAEDPGFDSRLRPGHFSGSSHTSDLKMRSSGYPPRRLAI